MCPNEVAELGASDDHRPVLAWIRATSPTERWLFGLELVVVVACLVGGFVFNWSGTAVAVIVPVGVGAVVALPPAVDTLNKLSQSRGQSEIQTEANDENHNEIKLRGWRNPRFDFFFKYPEGWARTDPANHDGNTYVSPEDTRVYVAFFGSYSPLTRDPEWRKDPHHYKGTLEDSRYAGGYISQKTGNGDAQRTEIPGWRIVERQQRQQNPDGYESRYLYQWFDAPDRTIGFVGKAPTAAYPHYLGLFQELIECIDINSHVNPAGGS